MSSVTGEIELLVDPEPTTHVEAMNITIEEPSDALPSRSYTETPFAHRSVSNTSSIFSSSSTSPVTYGANSSMSTGSGAYLQHKHLFSGRLVDYFFVYGISSSSHVYPLKSQPVSSTNSSPSNLPPATVHPLDMQFDPQLLMRYPLAGDTKNPVDDSFPPHLHFFCFAEFGALTLKHVPYSQPDFLNIPAASHSFVVTDEYGVKNYAFCWTIYEPLMARLQQTFQDQLNQWAKENYASTELEYVSHIEEKLIQEKHQLYQLESKILTTPRDPALSKNLSEQDFQAVHEQVDLEQSIHETKERISIYEALLKPYEKVLVKAKDLYCPKVLGVISHWPFYGLMRDWLLSLIRSSRSDEDQVHPAQYVCRRFPSERFICHFVSEIPLPAPGKCRLKIPLPLSSTFAFCSRPPLNCFPIIRDYSLDFLFTSLSIEHVVRVFECMLQECKIVLMSRSISVLNLAADALTSFLFPLFWPHVYIPVLPFPLLNYIHAPVPYIVGIHSDHLLKDSLPPDLVLVDLDEDRVMLTSPSSSSSAPVTSTRDVATASQNVSPLSAEKAFTVFGDPVSKATSLGFDFIALDEITSHLVPMLPQHDRRKLLARLTKYVCLRQLNVNDDISPQLLPQRIMDASWWSSVDEAHEFHLKKLTDSLQTSVNELTANIKKVALDFVKEKNNNEQLAGTEMKASLKGNESSGYPATSLSEIKKLQEEITIFGSKQLPAIPSSDKDLPVVPTLFSEQSFENLFNSPVISSSIETAQNQSNDNMKESSGESLAGTLVVDDRSVAVGNKPQSSNQASFIEFLQNSFLRKPSGGDATGKQRPSTNSLGVDIITRKPKSNSSSRRFRQQLSGFIDNSKKRIRGSLALDSRSRSSSVSTINSTGHNQELSNSETSQNDQSGALVVRRDPSLLSLPALNRDTSKLSLNSVQRHFVPFSKTDSKTNSEGGLEQNIHSSCLPPVFGYPLTVTLDSPLQWAIVQRARPVYKHGHELFQVYCVQQPMELPETYQSENCVPLGLCLLCEKSVEAPYISKVQHFWAVNTAGYSTLVESQPTQQLFKESRALQCRGCGVVVHEQCQFNHQHICARAVDETKVQESFLRFWTSMLKGYRQFLVAEDDASSPTRSLDEEGAKRSKPPPLPYLRKSFRDDFSSSNACPVFNKQDFIAQSGGDRETRNFLSGLCDTQAFAQFAYDRLEKISNDYEVLFFDEAIKAKLNRSKMKLSKESTPFLQDPAYAIQTTYECMSPDTSHLPGDDPGVTSGQFRTTWREHWAKPARKVEPLVTSKDAMKLKVHTSAIVRKARLQKMAKKKSTLSQLNWMTLKSRSQFDVKYKPKIYLTGELENLEDTVNDVDDDRKDMSMVSKAAVFLKVASGSDLVARRKSKALELESFQQKRASVNLKIDFIYNRLNALMAEAEAPAGSRQMAGPERFLEIRLHLEHIRQELLQCRVEVRQLFHAKSGTTTIPLSDLLSQASEESPTKSRSAAETGSTGVRTQPPTSEEDDILALEHQWHDLMDYCMVQLKKK